LADEELTSSRKFLAERGVKDGKRGEESDKVNPSTLEISKKAHTTSEAGSRGEKRSNQRGLLDCWWGNREKES